MEYKFTAHMEEELDEISEGARKGVDVLREFYTLLETYLKAAGESVGVKETGIPLDEKCPKCGAALVVKSGRFGQFKACSTYPTCKFRDSLDKKESKPLDEKCPECGSPLEQKFGRFGPFIACSDYPKCKYIKKDKPIETGIVCPTGCGGKHPEAENAPGQVLLRLQPLPEVPLRLVGRPDRTALPAVRGEDPVPEEPDQGRALHLLQEREVRVQGSGAPGEDLGDGRGGRGGRSARTVRSSGRGRARRGRAGRHR